MKSYFDRMSNEDIYKFAKRTIYALLYGSVILYIAVFFGPLQDNLLVIMGGALLIFVMLGVELYIPRYFSAYFRKVLYSDIDMGRYRDYFDYSYKKANRRQKRGALQSTHLADAQYHYFRGEFEQSLQSLNEIELKKVWWKRRKVLLTSLSYYRMLNKINQKDFSDFEDSLSLYRKMKGKNIPESSAKLLAIYRVASGQTTDYFETIAPKYKLHQIEAKYYAALNHLNQNQPEEAKECFREIANENPELFYVKEAKKCLGELA